MIEASSTSVVWKYESDSELFALYCVVRTLQNVESLYIPYLPNGRMDRIDEVEHNVFTLKWFAEIINSLNIKKVYTYDAHSNVSLGLINNIVSISPEKQIMALYKDLATTVGEDNLIVVFPDDGAAKRYRHIFEHEYSDISPHIVAGIKHREWSNGKLVSLDVVTDFDLSGKVALIIDDICSTGGTFLMCQKALEAKGVRASYLYVSYLEENSVNPELFEKFSGVYAGDELRLVTKKSVN